MRRLVGALVTSLLLLLDASSASAQRPRGVSQGGANETLDGVVVSSPGDEGPGRTGGSVRTIPRDNILVRQVVVNVLLEPCAYTEYIVYPGPVPQADRDGAAQEAGAANGLPRCQNDPGFGARLPTPGEVAEPFVRTIPLPVPSPEIDPGYNITGLVAYLETKNTTTHVVDGDTILGPINVTARGVYYVNWGDGTPEQGPYAFEGGPYPDGRITHLYERKGTYTVTVREVWEADWQLGGDSGTVPGLQTTASIPLEVRELQAVRRR